MEDPPEGESWDSVRPTWYCNYYYISATGLAFEYKMKEQYTLPDLESIYMRRKNESMPMSMLTVYW